ncbi:Ferric uptake regulation protein FUR, partial [Alcaligenes faecalis subsp. faecalis NCIB 8687]
MCAVSWGAGSVPEPRPSRADAPRFIAQGANPLLEAANPLLVMGHLTADDVYRQLIRQGSEIGLATVYRVQEFHDEVIEQRQQAIAQER